MMLPKGWKERKFGELADFRNGLNYTEKSAGETVKIIGIPDFSKKSQELDMGALSEVRIDRLLPEDCLKNNDILFVRSNGNKKLIGRSLLVSGIEEKVSFSGFIIRARLREFSQASLDYILHVVKSYSFMQEILRLGSGTNISSLSQDILKNISLPFPRLPEQKKIAAILSTWDRAVEKTEALLRNSEEQLKALMQQLLTGTKRLPGFTGEWEKRQLGEIATITNGASNKQDAALKGDYFFFGRSKDILRSSRFLFDSEAVIVPGEGQDFIPKYYVGKFDLHQRAYAILNFIHSYGRFIFYWVLQFQQYFLSQAVGSTVKSLRLPMFVNAPIFLPPLPEQKAIASVLTTAQKEVDKIKEKLARLKLEKSALMQQLLTGKRRVLDV